MACVDTRMCASSMDLRIHVIMLLRICSRDLSSNISHMFPKQLIAVHLTFGFGFSINVFISLKKNNNHNINILYIIYNNICICNL